MKKLEATLSKWLLPIASKLETNPQLTAIRRGMMTLVPVTLVGSVPILFNQLPGIPGMPEWFVNGCNYISGITNPINFATFGIMSIYVAAFIGYYYAQQRKVWDIGGILAAVMSFITVATLVTPEGGQDLSYFGGTGIFTAIIFALLSVEILYIFRHKFGFTIDLGEGVPTPIKRSFENLWPLLFSIVIVALIRFGVEAITGTPVVQIVELIVKPLTLSVNTLPGVVIMLLMIQLLWWFGIHGYSVMAPVFLSVAFQNADANAAMFQAGEAFSNMHIFTPDFMWNLAGLTGSGLTGALCILMVMSKSKRYKSIGRLAIVPSFFGIGEPQIFGLPVVLNPLMFIPWLLSSPIAGIIGWFAIDSGFMQPFTIVSPYTPIPIGGLVACMDWKFLIVAAVILAVVVLLYLPFFKIVEKQALRAEAEAANKAEESLDDLDFDI